MPLLVNGKIKQWKFFNQTIQNSAIPFISSRLQIVCSFINAFSSRATTNIDSGYEVAEQMLSQLNHKNKLQERLEQLNGERRLTWKKYDATMCLFPSMTENDVRDISLGKMKTFCSF